MKPADYCKSGSESSEQIALFMQCALYVGKYPELEWYFAIPNGGLRDKITSGKLKAEGVKAGVSDTALLVKRGCYSGLLIELKKRSVKPKKTTSKGGASDEQIKFGNFVKSQGYAFYICYGWEEAWDCIQWYLKLDNTLT